MLRLKRLFIEIETGLLEDKSVLATFLDVSFAHAYVCRDILINILIEEKCPIKIVKLVHN